MTPMARLAELYDLDLLLEQAHPPIPARLARLGFALTGFDSILRARHRQSEAAERRAVLAYERARARYGRGMASVRERACQGCFIKLPTAAAPGQGSVRLCESCGRVLFWR